MIFIPGVGGREWLWQHQIINLADLVTSEVMVLDRQTTRAEMAEYVLAHAPQRFSIAGHSLGGWVAQEVGTGEYFSGFWSHAERDLDGALRDRRPSAQH
jgi:pimeloyl-ACP methyl ester carboxylesterase